MKRKVRTQKREDRKENPELIRGQFAPVVQITGWALQLSTRSATMARHIKNCHKASIRTVFKPKKDTKKERNKQTKETKKETYKQGISQSNKQSDNQPMLVLFVGCLSSQQHASVSQGRICTDNLTCCHTEIEAADQTFHLTQSQYTDTGPTSPSADPITPGAWQGSHWNQPMRQPTNQPASQTTDW